MDCCGKTHSSIFVCRFFTLVSGKGTYLHPAMFVDHLLYHVFPTPQTFDMSPTSHDN